MIEYDEALRLVLEAVPANALAAERFSLLDAIGRFTASPIVSDRCYPPFDRATMDGYAVRFSDLDSDRPIAISATIFAGDAQRSYDSPVRIMTGAAVPIGADCVIQREEVDESQGDVISLTPKARISAGRNIARCGEDLKPGELIFPAGTQIQETMIGLLAAIGESHPLCSVSPRITIVSTGNEIVSIDDKPQPTQIRNSNAATLKAFFRRMNVPVQRTEHLRDDAASATPVLEECLHTDLLMLSGGVSAGDADFVPGVLRALGVQQIFHGVAIKPGKPIWFGYRDVDRHRTLVFALPGNPVAVQVALPLFIEPLLRRWHGAPLSSDLYLPLVGEARPDTRRMQVLPGRLVCGPQPGVEILATNGSGDIRASVGSDGLVFLERSWLPGDMVRFRLHGGGR